MNIVETRFPDVKIIEPQIFKDDRGFFMESYNQQKLAAVGIHDVFVQDNHSRSQKNTLRGLHFQTDPGQVKLVRCVAGKIWDVVVDIRPDSPYLGQWLGVELSEENKRMLHIPVGFAHGFCVLSDNADVLYKVTSFYNGDTEAGIMWDDKDIAIDWPVTDPVLSDRDLKNPSYKEYMQTIGVK